MAMRIAKRNAVRVPGFSALDDVVVEEPLDIRIDGVSMGITMRTPGDDLDLVAGWLVSERILADLSDVRTLAHLPGDDDENTVAVVLADGAEASLPPPRARFASSACGVCGRAAVPTQAPRNRLAFAPSSDVLTGWLARLSAHQIVFDATGGCHAALLLAADGSWEVAREDVGRHNAVDKAIGGALRAGWDPTDAHLIVTARAGYEIIDKAVAAGLATVVAMGAPTSLAIDVARAAAIALIGFARHDRHAVYNGSMAPEGQQG